MDIRVTLVVLTVSKTELQLVLPETAQALPSGSLEKGDPDTVAKKLASNLSGQANGVQRHAFLPPDEIGNEALTLVYTQLLPEDRVEGTRLIPVSSGQEALSPSEVHIVSRVVKDFKTDLDQVMHSRLNKRGLLHVLGLLPDIFDHKELAAAYYAFTGEKPPSALMLARMMLDRYTIGSGEKQREVKGRDLIREYEESEPELLDRKLNKNKELYRTGGPKAKRLYIKNLTS